MKIGLDLDGTIAIYDRVFHRHACAGFGMPATIQAEKGSIRDWFWSQPDGRERWIELQGLVYGSKMEEAEPAPGVPAFIEDCARFGILLCIISHKTQYPARGPQFDLRVAASAWLGRHLPFAGPVFFESTREEKIQRITAERCAVFIDDLIEVFEEPMFPSGVDRWLYDSTGRDDSHASPKVFSTWASIAGHLHEHHLAR